VKRWLLDVNVLLGCCWTNHADHTALFNWLTSVEEWATCPISELGFLRISMTMAYRASFEDARKSLSSLRSLGAHRFLVDDIDIAALPALVSYKETTDAHLFTLAKRHGLKLATLDIGLIAKPWAVGVAENPL
jgi:predicted nucleic acid-binding protein